MILVFDTETSTFPSSNLPANHPNQARIVQLAWLLLDEKFEERACFNSLIKLPSTVKIAEGAKKAHGISEEDCAKYGIEAEVAVSSLVQLAHKSSTIVGHNVSFDGKLIDIEYELLLGLSDKRWFNGCGGLFCTMEAMTPICKLPFANGKRAWGNQKYKWPTLQEAHCHAFGNKFEGAHDALADVRATARVYRWLMSSHCGSVNEKIMRQYDVNPLIDDPKFSKPLPEMKVV